MLSEVTLKVCVRTWNCRSTVLVLRLNLPDINALEMRRQTHTSIYLCFYSFKEEQKISSVV